MPHSRGRVRAPPRSGGACYPSAAEQRRIIAGICRVNSFSEDQVFGRVEMPPDECCSVEHLPRANAKARYYFGMDRKGYVLVSPRSRAAIRLWPSKETAEAVPARVARMLAATPAGQQARHTCDDPSCIRRMHVVPGSASDNLRDAYRRNRRNIRPPSPPPTRPTPRALPAPRLPPPPPECRSNDLLFCVTGYHSPGKLARKRARIADASPSGRRLHLQVRQRLPTTLPRTPL